MSLLPLLALMLLTGAFAGILAGLLGIGGGIILVPAFFYIFAALGYSGGGIMQMCVATSLATIVVTSFRSVQSHKGKGSLDRSILNAFAPGLALGAVVASFLVADLEGQTLQALFGVFGFLIAVWLIFGKSEWRLADEMPQGITRPAMGLGVGALSTVLGIGGGNIGVPLMTLYGVPIHRAVGTAAGFGLIIAAPAVVLFLMQETPQDLPPYSLGLVNIPAFVLVISMTLITTPLGVRLAHALPARPLKIIFACSIALAAANMGWQALSA